MLFLAYWKVNEGTAIEERMEAAQVIADRKLYPLSSLKSVQTWMTPGGWGMSLIDADSVKDVHMTFAVWRAALPGIFTAVDVSPCSPLEESIATQHEAIRLVAEEEAA